MRDLDDEMSTVWMGLARWYVVVGPLLERWVRDQRP